MNVRCFLLLPILFALLLLNSCRTMQVSEPAPVVSPAPTNVDIVLPVRQPAEPAVPSPRQKIRQQLAADNAPSALALILASGLTEAELAEEHGRAVKGVLNRADELARRDQPEKAGPLYRAALDGYPKTPAVAARVGKGSNEIAAEVDACADRLLERGLVAYRGGNLEQAIQTWRLILVFAPQHQASRKALQTAEVQLANLKKVRAETY